MELKPCPFCGSKVEGIYDGNFAIVCPKCPCEFYYVDHLLNSGIPIYKIDQEQATIKAWNKRR